MLTQTPTRNRIRRLNTRQRKKHHVGEFRELCFEVKITFKNPLAEHSYDAWWNAVINLIEARRLFVGGIGGRLPLGETSGIVLAADRHSPTEEDRKALLIHLRELPEVSCVHIGEFVDAWYEEFES